MRPRKRRRTQKKDETIKPRSLLPSFSQRQTAVSGKNRFVIPGGIPTLTAMDVAADFHRAFPLTHPVNDASSVIIVIISPGSPDVKKRGCIAANKCRNTFQQVLRLSLLFFAGDYFTPYPCSFSNSLIIGASRFAFHL